MCVCVCVYDERLHTASASGSPETPLVGVVAFLTQSSMTEPSGSGEAGAAAVAIDTQPTNDRRALVTERGRETE